MRAALSVLLCICVFCLGAVAQAAWNIAQYAFLGAVAATWLMAAVVLLNGDEAPECWFCQAQWPGEERCWRCQAAQ